MGLRAEREAAYALDYGLSRADLKPEVQATYDRLLAERRAGRPAQPAEFRFSFLSMGEPFTILASSGQDGYEVRTVADAAEHLSVRAMGGAEVAAVVRDFRTSGFRVVASGEQVALVRAKGLLRRRYLIDGASEPLRVTGKVYGGWYELSAGGANGLTRVQVLREKIARPLSTRINVWATIATGQDHLRCLAIVLGIEYLAEDRRQAFSELGLRRNLLSRGCSGRKAYERKMAGVRAKAQDQQRRQDRDRATPPMVKAGEAQEAGQALQHTHEHATGLLRDQTRRSMAWPGLRGAGSRP